MVVDGGRYDMVVNGFFEDLEGRMELNRVREFILKVGKKE